MLQSIAFIPDGNRRYAEKYGLSVLAGYRVGFQKAEQVFDWCLRIPGLVSATIYALSSENLRRDSYELRVLTKLYDEYFRLLAGHEKIHDNRVRVRVIGSASGLSGLEESVALLEESTKGYNDYELNIALGYGGRDELLTAFREMRDAGEDFTEANLRKHLFSRQDVDLLVRTGGWKRLSNFLPWQTAYSELYFTPKLWGEFDREEFDRSLSFFEDTQRNFGK